MNTLIRAGRLLPGTVVSAPKAPGIRHVGLISGAWRGRMPMVFASSPSTGGFDEIGWPQFSSGQLVRIDGYPGNLDPSEVIERATELIGLPYHLFSANCEHVVAYCHGLEPRSQQLEGALALCAIGAGLLALAKAA